MADSDVSDMIEDLLAENGVTVTYARDGCGESPVLMLRSSQKPLVLQDADNGRVTEIIVTDFLTAVGRLPFGDPQHGDVIRC